ncbi:cuticle protein CP575-like [Portunus trituberculatus]|uniref:cuticle protein CP575-like n=1 Tax=Portunus trituberculatus TaxID=210409 RepID=UPI001E1D0E42|nr:cuticle protein CP575-like [Portunus trituberculatus]XP_045114146.1 cuticle protein CP575-like [Portunus trituberculatus]XP_045114147.1 cuticle protein CP575-like [Portunus trituberculatus]
MRILSVILLAMVLFMGAFAAPPTAPKNVVIDLDKNTMSHEQYGEPGTAVHGRYKVEKPNGEWYTVEYRADHTGFHVLN